MPLNIQGIVVHCSASKWGDAEAINQWHTSKGWDGIGYHGVILNGFRSYADLTKDRYSRELDGKIEPGRGENKMGAHCLAEGMNQCTLGVCLIGVPGFRNTDYPETFSDICIKTCKEAKLIYATERQLNALVHYLTVKCETYKLDPTGRFIHNGKKQYVISQHSDHDKGKPLCASLYMDTIRRLVAKNMEG